jgi:phage shock protein PspC (stress-responsive transcriptional regulator)
MAELLTERGVTSDKVVLASDVAYLKEQLGTPEDFGSDDENDEKANDQTQAKKRLFRDADGALIAGVSAGIANYFGIDSVLVRIIFVVLAIFGGGSGIVLYLLLWLVLPAATTTSEKLQMQGKPVTLEALKDSVSKADVSGAARRINSKLLSFIDSMFRLFIRVLGIGFILSGLGILFGTAATRVYMMLHDGKLFQENLFPIGSREQLLVWSAMLVAAIVSIFLMLTGIATFKRKWPVRSWITGILVGVFLIGSVLSVALTADAVPRVRERYETNLHTTPVKNIQPFHKVVTSGNVDISYISAPNYGVDVHYEGDPDLSKLKIEVRDNILYVDSQGLDGAKHCTMLCLFPRYDMTVQVFAPNVQDFVTPPSTDIFYPNVPVPPTKVD